MSDFFSCASSSGPAEYLRELTRFPYGRYDDQGDATAQFLDWYNTSGREPGIVGYYRILAAEWRREVAAGKREESQRATL